MECSTNPKHSVLASMAKQKNNKILISYFCVVCGLIGLEGWEDVDPLDKTN